MPAVFILFWDFLFFLFIFKRENMKIRKKGRWGEDLGGVEGRKRKTENNKKEENAVCSVAVQQRLLNA